MGKPRVKLKAAQARKPPAQSRNLDRALHLLAEAVGMTSAEVLRKPYEARDRFKRLQAEHQQAQARHRKSIDHAAIYARQNGSKERHA